MESYILEAIQERVSERCRPRFCILHHCILAKATCSLGDQFWAKMGELIPIQAAG